MFLKKINYLLLLVFLVFSGFQACGGEGALPVPDPGDENPPSSGGQTFETPINTQSANVVVGEDSLSVTIDFGTEVSGLTAEDIAIIGGAGSSLLSIETNDNQVFTLIFTIPTEAAGTLAIQIPEGAVQNSDGTNNAATAVLNFSYDNQAPTVVLTTTASPSSNDSPMSFTLTFSEEITGLDISDLVVSNGNASNLNTSDNVVFTFLLTPSSQGLVSVDLAAASVQDLAGNDNEAAAQLSRNYDSIAPTVVLSSGASNPSNTSPILLNVVFSEVVNGLSLSDFQLSNASLTNLTDLGGGNYSLQVHPSADGAVSVLLPASQAMDFAGNTNSASNAFNRDFDATPPSPVVTSVEPSPTASSTFVVTINFGEVVSGLSLGEVQVSNALAANLVDLNGQNYTVEISPSAEGAVTVSLAASVAQDAAGNLSAASNIFSIDYQLGAPTVYLQEDFEGIADGSPWPAPWSLSDGSTAASTTVQSGQGCLEGFVLAPGMNPSGQDNLVRMRTSGISVQDFEAEYEVIFEDYQNQGQGFYGRQNGGFLSPNPFLHGQGYGFFLEGIITDEMTFWYEEDGDEIRHEALSITDAIGAPQFVLITPHFHVRYQVEQVSPTETINRAKIWLDGDPEPVAWQMISDEIGEELPGVNPNTVPHLQNISDGFIFDLYNSNNPSSGSPVTQSLCIDNLVITELQQSPGPLEATDPIALVVNQHAGTNFEFLEGPVWRESDQLLYFTDIPNDRLYALDPNDDSTSIVRAEATPGSETYANGLANDINGDLLIAEQSSQAIIRRLAGGVEQVVVDNNGGTVFNSPNDVISHSNGDIYFTDPDYGNLFEPGLSQPLGFEAVYRFSAGGALTQIATLNGPNGVALSPDESRLYVSEFDGNAVRVFQLNPDGTVVGELPGEALSTTGTGGGGGDGMAVDIEGNLYISTENGVWVVASAGTVWGLISTPSAVRNVAFGDADHRTLYIALGDFASGSLYRVRLNIPGVVAPFNINN